MADFKQPGLGVGGSGQEPVGPFQAVLLGNENPGFWLWAPVRPEVLGTGFSSLWFSELCFPLCSSIDAVTCGGN